MAVLVGLVYVVRMHVLADLVEMALGGSDDIGWMVGEELGT